MNTYKQQTRKKETEKSTIQTEKAQMFHIYNFQRKFPVESMHNSKWLNMMHYMHTVHSTYVWL